MYTVKRIGVLSAIKVGAIISAMIVVVPIIVLLILNGLFKIFIIPPELIIQSLASMAFWAAVWGGITTGVIVVIYNVSAHFFGGVQVELKLQQPPRKNHESIDIE